MVYYCYWEAARKSLEAEGNGEDVHWSNLYDLEEPQSINVSHPKYSGSFPNKDEESKTDRKQQTAENRDGPKLLPFEFVALEACLEAACSVLDNEARTLEQEAHPALEKLTTKISTLNLERVRQIKSRLVAITGRVQKLREYVDDTEDYINIMLDDKQNHLLQMGVMLTTATLVVSAFVVVAGVFGVNIQIELFDPNKAGMPQFLWTIGGSATGTIFLYVIAIAWCKQKRLIE